MKFTKSYSNGVSFQQVLDVEVTKTSTSCILMLAALALIMTCGHVLASSQSLLPCGLYGGQRSDC